MNIPPNELARRIMQKLLDHALLVGLPDERVGKIRDCIELTLFRNQALCDSTERGDNLKG